MKCTVLIVDDEIDILEVMSELLRYQGFRVLTACCVRDACAMLERESVDLVLSDVIMPEAPGTALRRYMQSDRRYQDIPIVFMTAFAPVSEPLTGPVLGKPFDCDDLLSVMDKVLQATYRTSRPCPTIHNPIESPSLYQSHLH